MNGTQARPLSIQTTGRLGNRSLSPSSHPVGHMDHVAKHERDRMHADEAVDLAGPLVMPGRTRVEAERQAGLLDRRIDLHVLVVVDRLVPDRGDVESHDARLVGELLDRLQRCVGVAERQVDHRRHAVVAGEDLLGEPAVVREGKLDFHLRVWGEARAGASASGTSPGSRCRARSIDRLAMTTSRWTLSSAISSKRAPPACWMRPATFWKLRPGWAFRSPPGLLPSGPFERLGHVAHHRILDVLDDARP